MPEEHYTEFYATETSLGRITFILFCSVVVSLGMVQIRIPIGPIELGLTEILFLLFLPFWIVRLLFNRPNMPGKWVWLALTLYLSTGLLASVFSISTRSSLKHVLGETYLGLLFLASTTVISDLKKARTAMIAWLLGAVIASVTALITIGIFYLNPHSTLLESLTYHYGSVPVGNFPRVTATFASASLFFNYLSVSIVLLLCCRRIGWMSRRLFQVLLTAAAITAIFTFSIGLGSFFLIGAWLLYRSDSSKTQTRYLIARILFAASLIWLVLAVVALSPFPEAPFTIRLPGTEFQLYPSARYLVWQDTLRTVGSHFLLGVGPGNPVCDVIFTNTDGSLSLLTDAHNTFLNVLAERGIVGALSLIITLILIIRRKPLSKQSEEPSSLEIVTNGLGFALLIGFVYQGLVGSFEDARHLWALMGFVMAANGIHEKDSNSPRLGETRIK